MNTDLMQCGRGTVKIGATFDINAPATRLYMYILSIKVLNIVLNVHVYSDAMK